MLTTLYVFLISVPTNNSLDEWLTSTSSGTSKLKSAWIALNEGRPKDVLKFLPPPADRDLLDEWLAAQALEPSSSQSALEALTKPVASRCVSSTEDTPRREYVRLKASLIAKESPRKAAKLIATLETPTAYAKAIAWANQRGDSRVWRRRLLLEHPASSEAKDIFERLGPTDTLGAFKTIDERIALVTALLEAHENTKALELSEALKSTLETTAQKCRLGYVIGKALRKRRYYDRSLEELTQTRELCSKAIAEGHTGLEEQTMQAALLEARVLAIKSQGEGIDSLATWMEGFSPGHSYIDDVHYWAAKNFEGDAARERFARVVEINGDQAPIAAWRLAQSALSSDELDLAKEWLTRIPQMDDASRDDVERAEFFMGRIEVQTSTQNLSRWKQLALKPSFYGFLALERLREYSSSDAEQIDRKLMTAASSTQSYTLSDKILSSSSALQARRWLEAGARDWAVAELRELECALDVSNQADILTLSLLFDAFEEYSRAQLLIRGPGRIITNKGFSDDTIVAWRLAYSRPFVAEIEAAAGTENIDPLFLTALAREESTFDPGIVSWAGATGLAQLMPATANEAYETVYGGHLDVARLTEVALNLRLGARVLARALRSFDGHEPFALSAYNGGAGLTRRTFPDEVVPFEEWVESNPVKENRSYVKRVMATWGVYQLLHGQNYRGLRLPKTVGPRGVVRF